MGHSVPAVLQGVVSAHRGAEGAVFSVDFTRIVMTVSQVNNNIALIKMKNNWMCVMLVRLHYAHE